MQKWKQYKEGDSKYDNDVDKCSLKNNHILRQFDISAISK